MRHLRRDRTAEYPKNPLLFVPSHPSRELEVDLKAAGIPKVTKEGKIDFHSCRVAFVTLVLEAGASAKEAQTLARHATPELTMNVYARTRDARLSLVAEHVGDRILNGGSIKYAERGLGKNITPLPTSSYMVEGLLYKYNLVSFEYYCATY